MLVLGLGNKHPFRAPKYRAEDAPHPFAQTRKNYLDSTKNPLNVLSSKHPSKAPSALEIGRRPQNMREDCQRNEVRDVRQGCSISKGCGTRG